MGGACSVFVKTATAPFGCLPAAWMDCTPAVRECVPHDHKFAHHMDKHGMDARLRVAAVEFSNGQVVPNTTQQTRHM